MEATPGASGAIPMKIHATLTAGLMKKKKMGTNVSVNANPIIKIQKII